MKSNQLALLRRLPSTNVEGNHNVPNAALDQRRSCIYAVTPWLAHRQVKKKENKKKRCIVNFNSIINISLIRRTSYFCMVIMWRTSRVDALYTFKTSISSCGPCVRTLTKPRRWQFEILKWTCAKQWRCSYLLRHEGQILDNFKKFLSIKVIKIVLDSML